MVRSCRALASRGYRCLSQALLSACADQNSPERTSKTPNSEAERGSCEYVVLGVSGRQAEAWTTNKHARSVPEVIRSKCFTVLLRRRNNRTLRLRDPRSASGELWRTGSTAVTNPTNCPAGKRGEEHGLRRMGGASRQARPFPIPLSCRSICYRTTSCFPNKKLQNDRRQQAAQQDVARSLPFDARRWAFSVRRSLWLRPTAALRDSWLLPIGGE
jgi:hypothetical protein